MRKRKNNPEYIVICREFNRPAAEIIISVIDSGITESLLKKLIMLRHIDTHRRYFLTTKRYYQKFGAVLKKQIETMYFQGNKNVVELGAVLDEEKGSESGKD